MTKQEEFRKLTEEAKFEVFAVMCEKVADLEKENAELKARVEKQDSDISLLKHLTESQRIQIEALDGQIPWKDIKEKSEIIKENTELKDKLAEVQMRKAGEKSDLVWKLKNANEQKDKQLTTAKEIIKTFLQTLKNEDSDYTFVLKNNARVIVESEQFLRETDINDAIQKASEGLDLDKIADEIEKDIKEQFIKE